LRVSTRQPRVRKIGALGCSVHRVMRQVMTLSGLRAIVAWVLKATLLQQRFQVVAPHPEAVIEHAEIRS